MRLLLFKCVTYWYERRILSKCPVNNQKTTCFVVFPYHFTHDLKSFAFSDSAQVVNFILNTLAAQFHVLHFCSIGLWLVHFGFLFELISGCGVLGSIPRIPAPPFFTFPFLLSSSQATWKTGQFTLLSWDSIIHLCFRESCGYNSSINSKKFVYIVLQSIQRKLCA